MPRKTSPKLPEPEHPTDIEWTQATLRFGIFRELETAAAVESARGLVALITNEAEAIYRTANILERTGKADVDVPTSYSTDAIEKHIFDRGYARDKMADYWVSLCLKSDVREPAVAEPTALRKRGHVIVGVAEALSDVIDKYEEVAKMIRLGERGRRPSVAMFFLIRDTDKWNMTIPAVARGLVEHEVWPDNYDPDGEDAVEQWIVNLKKARRDFRKLRAKLDAKRGTS